MTVSKQNWNKKTELFYFLTGLLVGIVLLAACNKTPTFYNANSNGNSDQVRLSSISNSSCIKLSDSPKKIEHYQVLKFFSSISWQKFMKKKQSN